MEEKRVGFKFNILDIIIVIFIIAAAAGVLIKSGMLGGTLSAAEPVPISFSVKIENVRTYTIDAFNIGDGLYDAETGAYLGVITAIEKTPYKTYVVHIDGSLTLEPVPEKYTLMITVEGTGKVTGTGNYINGNRIVSPGAGLQISTKYALTEGTVITSEAQG